MNKERTPAIFLSTLACAIGAALVASPGAFAQGVSDSGNEGLLEEVIVTATRREEALQDVALAVAVIDTRDYIDAGFTNLDDILPFVPGVSVDTSGRPYFNQVLIRGIDAQISAGVVSYVDEIPFGSSTVYTNPTPLDGTLLDLGTLDVMKGPQGTLYGASAMGGILKFNTREASLRDWTGSATANLSDTNEGGFNQLYRVNLNGPILEDTLGMSFTAFYDDNDGFIDNVSIGEENWDAYEYYGGSGSLRWVATERLEITLLGLYQKVTQDGIGNIQANYAQDLPIPGFGPAEPIYGKYETGQLDFNPTDYEAQLFGLTVDYDLDFADLTSVTSWQEMSFLNTVDVTVPFASFADLFFPDNAPHSSALLVGDLGFDKFTQELRLTSESNERFEWIVGAFYSDEDGYNIQDLVLTPDSPLYFANFPSAYEEMSLFATGTWFFTPDFDASLGLRWTDYENDVELSAGGPLLAPLPYTKIEDNVTNFLFSMRYRPSEELSLYGRVASGFRPGGANFVILDPGTGDPLTNTFFEPDDLVSYELGAKGRSGDGRFTWDVAAFYIDWQDYQITVTRGGVNVVGNADKAVSRGLEATVGFAVTDALTLTASGAWIDAELAADDPDLGGADGNQLPNTPEWQAVLGADYRFTFFDLPAFVGASWRYKGEMPVGFEGYTDAEGTFFPPSAPRVELDSYQLVDLSAGVSVGAFDLSLYVTNVFDEWAYTGFGPTFAAIPTGTPTRPRTIGGVVRWNFR